MKVLLVETSKYAPVTPLFGDALRSLPGVTGEFVDEKSFVTKLDGTKIHSLLYRLRRRRPIGAKAFNRGVLEAARRLHPDVVLVVKGPFLEPDTLRAIKSQTGALLINYATDDPFNVRVATSMMRKSLSLFDLYACTKTAVIEDVLAAGCPRAEFVPFAYNPVLHHPEDVVEPRFMCDVAFIGGADQDRIPYFEALGQALPDVALNLYGGYWDRQPRLRRSAKGFVEGASFRQAVSGAKVNINLVRRANRDGHVMRSFELPACGGFSLMERTAEHRVLFEDGVHTRFFGEPDEMVAVIADVLGAEDERETIAAAGRDHVVNGNNTYEDRLKQILGLIGN